jgi:hypothetical protein
MHCCEELRIWKSGSSPEQSARGLMDHNDKNENLKNIDTKHQEDSSNKEGKPRKFNTAEIAKKIGPFFNCAKAFFRVINFNIL